MNGQKGNQERVHLGESDPHVRVTRLPNGFTIATDRMAHVETASLGVFVAAGSRHEREAEHGVSHLLEHMAFKGTSRRSARQIAEDIENVGGDINAATSVESTSYTARVLAGDLAVAVEVLGDIITSSVFDETELAREKNVILQEHAAAEDVPEDLVTEAFMEVAFAGQAIGRPILGEPKTIRAFDSGLIRAFLEREYAPNRMVLAASGAVEHERLVELASHWFGEAAPRDVPEVAPGRYVGGERRVKRRLEQANLVIGLPGVSFRDPAYFATQIFSFALGGGLTSRLWQEVRENRGLAYAIDAFHWPFSDCGLFGIGAGTSGNDLPELLDVTFATTRRAVDDIELQEVDRAKAQFKLSLLAGLETPGGRIDRAARQLLAWGRVLPAQELVAAIDAVTVEDVRAAGRQVLAGPPTLAAIGPIRRLPPLSEIAAALRA